MPAAKRAISGLFRAGKWKHPIMRVALEVWRHWPGFALRQADIPVLYGMVVPMLKNQLLHR